LHAVSLSPADRGFLFGFHENRLSKEQRHTVARRRRLRYLV
jgi:hypothetical protein